jgi:hypothetical protein
MTLLNQSDVTTVPIGNPILDVATSQPDDQRLTSVTTIIGCLDKAALLGWAAEETAKCAVRSAGSLPQRIEEEGEDAVIEWLAGARYRRPKDQRSATQLGTDVHAACERFAITGVLPDVDDEVRPYLVQFDRWAQRVQPEYHAAEMTVYSPTHGYAGTADFVATINGTTYIGDYKSATKSTDRNGNPTTPWGEVGLQLAAYRGADLAATTRPRRFEENRHRTYLYGAAEMAAAAPMPQVDTGLVVHITPEHYQGYQVECGSEIHELFVHVGFSHRWVSEVSKRVIGERL